MRYREAKGLVLIALKRFDKDKGPVVLTRMREESTEAPPYGATYWKLPGEKWNHDFGGQWIERGDGRVEWRWN